MKKRLFLAAVALAAFAAAPAKAVDYYVGQIQPFAFLFCPTGWHAADGTILPIASNVELFALIGTTYGGDGLTTFALPRVTGKTTAPPAAKPLTYCIATSGVFPTRGPAPKIPPKKP